MPRLRNHPVKVAANRATRERLLDAACEELVEVGYFETDTNKIARRGGLAPATFYKHFRNKTEVFAAAFERLAVAEAQQLGDACLSYLQAGTALDDVAARFAQALIESRRHLVVLRSHATVLQSTEPTVREAKVTVRRLAVEAATGYAAMAGLETCSLEELHVRMYVIDGLADAVARGDFGQHGVTDMTAHREIVTQWKACFVLPGTFEPDQS